MLVRIDPLHHDCTFLSFFFQFFDVVVVAVVVVFFLFSFKFNSFILVFLSGFDMSERVGEGLCPSLSLCVGV